MFDMVLKFGSYIVDELCSYLQPVIVYIPPYGELRGGAWAVVDKMINPRCMHIYADSRSRGGVLEPEGTVQVKMRKVSNFIKTLRTLFSRVLQFLGQFPTLSRIF